MDDRLPDPTDSILWTDEFFGTGNGEVLDGPFTNFEPRPDSAVPAFFNETKLVRAIGQNELGTYILIV